MAKPPPDGDPWETNSRYAGMTTNERIFEAGLIGHWDEALARRDRLALIAILETVSLTRAAAEYVTDTVIERQK